MLKHALGAVGLCLALGSQAAVAQTTIKWMHLEVNPNQVKIWERRPAPSKPRTRA